MKKKDKKQMKKAARWLANLVEEQLNKTRGVAEDEGGAGGTGHTSNGYLHLVNGNANAGRANANDAGTGGTSTGTGTGTETPEEQAQRIYEANLVNEFERKLARENTDIAKKEGENTKKQEHLEHMHKLLQQYAKGIEALKSMVEGDKALLDKDAQNYREKISNKFETIARQGGEYDNLLKHLNSTLQNYYRDIDERQKDLSSSRNTFLDGMEKKLVTIEELRTNKPINDDRKKVIKRVIDGLKKILPTGADELRKNAEDESRTNVDTIIGGGDFEPLIKKYKNKETAEEEREDHRAAVQAAKLAAEKAKQNARNRLGFVGDRENDAACRWVVARNARGKVVFTAHAVNGGTAFELYRNGRAATLPRERLLGYMRGLGLSPSFHSNIPMVSRYTDLAHNYNLNVY